MLLETIHGELAPRDLAGAFKKTGVAHWFEAQGTGSHEANDRSCCRLIVHGRQMNLGSGAMAALLRQAEIGPECVKTLSRTLAMISEDFIAGIAHEALYPR
jgi:hypothetical protein